MLIAIEEQAVLDRIQTWLKTTIVPQANSLDADPYALATAMAGLAQLGVFGLRVPAQWDGLAVSNTAFSLVQEQITRHSGALAFLQVQAQSAIAMLLKSKNAALQKTYLPRLSQGEVFWGVGFSHLRRPGSPLLQALPVKDGYELTGQIPWLTGAGCFEAAIAAAVLPEGQAVFGRIPLANAQQAAGGTIRISPPFRLATMTSTQTVRAQLEGWLVADPDLVDLQPAGWIDHNDRQNVLKSTWLTLGCAGASLDAIAHYLQQKPLDFIAEALSKLSQEVEDCRQQIWRSQQQTVSDPDLFKQQLQLRAWSIDLAVRSAHAAVTIVGGAANDLNHPAQRIYREALMFTVSGETPKIMSAILKRLTSRILI
ncbi:MAG: acyl-CoA/acyl-ACP dehydrogenase [Aphanocapsa sp. GSE-SYN-MK-11-07L]|jgi:alkylation response protein AidB-like acyl-CoA dehydrogenase|nr:acyl-CoA/acyl-ACP dehydrogenase [Aphanocapsa sp. GSE-SYN-MK-11-07L]